MLTLRLVLSLCLLLLGLVTVVCGWRGLFTFISANDSREALRKRRRRAELTHLGVDVLARGGMGMQRIASALGCKRRARYNHSGQEVIPRELGIHAAGMTVLMQIPLRCAPCACNSRCPNCSPMKIIDFSLRSSR